ncbi:hypothetical protein A2U01_0107847, partial [Trifolium medium]|nr:hypothetical protein [Trifolium medium]
MMMVVVVVGIGGMELVEREGKEVVVERSEGLEWMVVGRDGIQLVEREGNEVVVERSEGL